MGISSNNPGRIWNPFRKVEQTTSRTAGGTGLGLSVAKRLADPLRGRRIAEKNPGCRTPLTLWLPRSIRESAPRNGA